MEVNSRNSQLFLSLSLSRLSSPFIVLLSSKLNFTSIGKGILPFELYNRVSSVTVK